jgi:hypothetical protein
MIDMSRMWLFIMLLAIGTGCKDPYMPVPILPTPKSPCSDSTELKPVWQIPLTKDTQRFGTADILCYDDKVTPFIENNSGRLCQYNGKTGAIEWMWENPSLKEFVGQDLAMYYQNGQIVYNGIYSTTTISTTNASIIKRAASLKNLYGESRFALLGNFIYQGFYHVDQFTDSIHYFMRADVNTLKWDTLLKLRREDHFGYMGGIEPPALYAPKMSDSLVLFKFRTVINAKNRCFFYGYNLSKRQVQWRIDSLDYDGNVYPPIIEGNRCYVQGLGTVFCINADNGQIIWQRFCGGRFPGGSNLISYQDRLAAVTLDGRFVCIDKETGALIFNQKDAVGGAFDLASPSAGVEYNGVLYIMGDGYFYGIDLITGQILGKYQTPNRCKHPGAIFGYGAIAVNKQLGYIYVDDQFYLMAIKAFK